MHIKKYKRIIFYPILTIIVGFGIFYIASIVIVFFHVDTESIRILNDTKETIWIQPIFQNRDRSYKEGYTPLNPSDQDRCSFGSFGTSTSNTCYRAIETGQGMELFDSESSLAYIEYLIPIGDWRNVRYFCPPVAPEFTPSYKPSYKEKNVTKLFKEIFTGEAFVKTYRWSGFRDILPDEPFPVGIFNPDDRESIHNECSKKN